VETASFEENVCRMKRVHNADFLSRGRVFRMSMENRENFSGWLKYNEGLRTRKL
jgi:hypothetical protein